MNKNLSLIIKADQEFIRHTEEDLTTNLPVLSNFYQSVTEIYIPLLEMLDSFVKDKVPCKIGLVLPPVLCNLLVDKTIQTSYIDYLDKEYQLGKKKEERNSINPLIKKNIEEELERISKTKDLFVNKYSNNLLAAFSSFAEEGLVEILGTCGTEIFMPHYADLKEIISAQIESGLHSYKQAFNTVPDGFWLPFCGYAPGVEKLIRAYGYSYTILNPRATLLSEKMPENGIFYPCRTENALAIFAHDMGVYDRLYGQDGYFRASEYRNENRDIGFDLPMEDLMPLSQDQKIRFSTGYKYWNRNFKDEEKSLYDSSAARKKALEQAKDFVADKASVLNQAAELLKDRDFVTLTCVFNTSDFMKNWHEGLFWLENVIRMAGKEGMTLTFCREMVENRYELEKIQPYYSANCGAGYGESLLSSKNCWMMRYLRKASERMIDLADRFPDETGLKNRLLNLGAKELMLAQSGRIALNIDNSMYPEFSHRRFKESIAAFTTVFDSLGSNVVSTEWLTKLELSDSIFPWMNYRIFSRKK